MRLHPIPSTVSKKHRINLKTHSKQGHRQSLILKWLVNYKNRDFICQNLKLILPGAQTTTGSGRSMVLGVRLQRMFTLSVLQCALVQHAFVRNHICADVYVIFCIFVFALLCWIFLVLWLCEYVFEIFSFVCWSKYMRTHKSAMKEPLKPLI